MARPKKKRGYRSITVNSETYRWRFEPGSPDSCLRVTATDVKGQVLVVRMAGWVDPWLSLSGFAIEGNHLQLYSSARNEPALVTSAFVRRVIEFGLNHGWKPDVAAADFRMESDNGELKLPSDSTRDD